MAYSAIAVEGGLLPPDLLERIAEGDAEGLRPVDFDLDKGVRLTDEFQSAFSDVGSLWRGFDVRLRSSKDSRTTLTREFWMKPALERLGYGTLTYQQASLFAGGESFDISHRAGEDELAPPVHIVSLDQPLGTRGERSRRSPHATVQEYLNRSDALWGLVTNGERIRLLRDSSRISHPTYAEFDLRPMIEGNLYSEFTILYRILHRTRLPRDHANPHECLLENWYQRGVDEGNRVRDHLRDGVEAALKVLGTGFLAHPGSDGLRRALADGTLTEAAFYRQLLRLVYRLLFLFTIEERRLVLPYTTEHRERQTIYANYYSVNRLRERCERPFADDQYADLWPGLCRTFTLFRDDDAARSLGLAALNGELFGPDGCKDLETAQCMNKALLLGIYHLSTFGDGKVRRRVNYAALDVEELGSVYESLLDYRPHLTHDPWRFDLAVGSERKTTGSYYTPPELVHELVESALVPVMDERVNSAKTADEKAKALLAMRVCDPASGSGHFLLAAARRMARELARIRTGEAEPSPEEFRVAERDVIRHCIYAVDKNPLAVDLCKVALWLESHDTGKPLSFLDHHIRCGDSLVGVFDLTAMERGIPDDAFNPKPGDDKKLASAVKKRNKQELRQDALFGNQMTFFATPEEVQAYFARMGGPDDTVNDVYAKERTFRSHMRSVTAWKRRLMADLWTAAFYWPLGAGTAEPPTNATWRRLTSDPHLTEYISPEGAAYRGTSAYQTVRRARSISRQHQFFHWPLEFPEVFDGDEPGFDVILGNPPWERIKLQEDEFFAERDPEIAHAPNSATRKRLIATLPERNSALAEELTQAQHDAEGQSLFLRTSGRFPLCGRGDINTYAIFAEQSRRLVAPPGRAGIIVPSGIATDDTTKFFFGDLVETETIASLAGYENEEGIFDRRYVHHSTKFCLLTMTGKSLPEAIADFCFFLRQVSQIKEEHRHFQLLRQDIMLLNPNTRTCPIFRTRRDADLTRAIYRRVPVLLREGPVEQNPWLISIRRVFDMNKAETLAHCRNSNEPRPDGMTAMYESKLVHQYDHRWATYEDIFPRALPSGKRADPRPLLPTEKNDNAHTIVPFYWVPNKAVDKSISERWTHKWLLCWRDITSSTNERSVIAAILPRTGTDFTLRVGFPNWDGGRSAYLLLANLNAFVFDYVTRQMLGGTHLSDYILKQLPVIPPSSYESESAWLPGGTLKAWIARRILELTYTSWDLVSFARDMDYDGPPFAWDTERRFLLRCELDAAFFHLYGLARDDVSYVMDTFSGSGGDGGLRGKDEKRYGEYRTKRVILEQYDTMAEAISRNERAPSVAASNG